MDTLTHDDIRAAVRSRYGTIAETRGASAPQPGLVLHRSPAPEAGSTACGGGSATTTLDMQAQAYGYSAADTSAVPVGANLGLGCGSRLPWRPYGQERRRQSRQWRGRCFLGGPCCEGDRTGDWGGHDACNAPKRPGRTLPKAATPVGFRLGGDRAPAGGRCGVDVIISNV